MQSRGEAFHAFRAGVRQWVWILSQVTVYPGDNPQHEITLTSRRVSDH